MYDLKFNILIPTYNNADVIRDTLKSILSQSFTNFEIIVQQDGSTDNTEEIVKSFNDKRIKFFKNERNLGYSKTLNVGIKHCKGDIIYLMGDDILGKNALLNTYKAFKISDDVGVVTRPYYWFCKDIHTPIRETGRINPEKNEIIKITDELYKIIMVFWTSGQLSGLAYRAKYIDMPFHEDCFTAHVYPFASIFKKHPVVFLKDYTVAVRIGKSQTRTISSIYDKSPMQSWIDLFNTVFYEKEFEEIRKNIIKNYVSTNYVGLVQIRNYARYRYLLREIYLLLKYRWQNVFNPGFWFLGLGCIIMPPFLLAPLVDWYKDEINSRRLKYFKHIEFQYDL